MPIEHPFASRKFASHLTLYKRWNGIQVLHTMGDQLRLIRMAFSLLGPYLRRLIYLRFSALRQRWTYKVVPDAKNVVVLGGSFAGFELVNDLATTLPTGFKIVLIEKNSHFNYSFTFPRFSVVPGYEHTAFIPYDGIAKGAPAGLVTRIQDTVIGLTETHVLLASGREIDYEYLAIATGSSQPLPVQVSATEFRPACRELQSVQETIKESQKIAIVGAGAVGVELATDIKGFYPEKDVTLVHSRGQILNTFGKRLHDYTLPIIRDEHKIRVLLNERPQIPKDRALLKQQTLAFSDGREESFDLVVSLSAWVFCWADTIPRSHAPASDPIRPSSRPYCLRPSPRRRHASS